MGNATRSFNLRVLTGALLALLAMALPCAAAATPEEQLAAASALFDAKKYAEAARQLDSFLAANPKHARVGVAALALGRCRAQLKQWDPAIAAYEKALAGKDAAVLTDARLGLGEAAMSAARYEKAVPALEEVVKAPLPASQAAVAWYWLAQASFRLQRYDAAERHYARVIQDYPRAEFIDAAHFGAGVAAFRQGKIEEARTKLRTVVDRYPKSEDRLQTRLVLAQIELDGKRYREARSAFDTLMRDPAFSKTDRETQASAEDGLIQALLELGEYPAASTRLEAALGRLPAGDPQRFRAQLSLGHCRYRQKQYAPAVAAYSEAAEGKDPALAAEALYWSGNAAAALERPEDAARQWSQLVSRFPKHTLAPKAQLKAAEALQAVMKPSAAAAAYRLVIKQYPAAPEAETARKALSELVDAFTDPVQLAEALKTASPAERARGQLRLGRLQVEAKKYPEAAVPLVELLKSKPAPDVTAEARYLLGVAYDGQRKAGPAVACLAEAVRLAPSAPWAGNAQSRLAWLYLDQKQPAAAERAAAAALSLKPGEAAEQQARLAQVQAQLDQQKWDAALEGCKALLSGRPTPEVLATALFTQAWVAEKQGRPEEALPLWERLAAEQPRSSYAAEALLYIGDARLKTEKFEEASQKYQALLDGFPKSPLAPEARFKLGSAFYNLNRTQDAAAQWEQVAADPAAGDFIPEALYWAGVALDKGDRKDLAIQRLSRLVAQYPKHARVPQAKVRLAALKAVAAK